MTFQHRKWGRHSAAGKSVALLGGVSQGGGQTRIAYDSPLSHPDAWASDDFNYPSTAAWLAANRAKPHYTEASAIPAGVTIDPTITFGGRPTLKSAPATGRGLMLFALPSPAQKMFFRVGYDFTAGTPAISSYLNSLDFLDSYALYNAQAGIEYNVAGGKWDDPQNNLPYLTEAIGALSGRRIWCGSVERVAPDTAKLNMWQNGVRMTTDLLSAAYGAFAAYGTLEFYMGGTDSSTAFGYNHLLYEAIVGDGLAELPWTGLAT